MQLSFAFHILGVIFWMAGLLVLTGLIRFFESHPSEKSGMTYQSLCRKYFFGFVVPGIVITSLSGFHQFGVIGVSYYMRQGWMHGKVTLLIFLFAVSWILFRAVNDIKAGKKLNPKKFGMLHGLVGACIIGILIMTYLGRIQ